MNALAGDLEGILCCRFISSNRRKYFQAILRQDISYFDNVVGGEISNNISYGIDMIQECISEKVKALRSILKVDGIHIIVFLNFRLRPNCRLHRATKACRYYLLSHSIILVHIHWLQRCAPTTRREVALGTILCHRVRKTSSVVSRHGSGFWNRKICHSIRSSFDRRTTYWAKNGPGVSFHVRSHIFVAPSQLRACILYIESPGQISNFIRVWSSHG